LYYSQTIAKHSFIPKMFGQTLLLFAFTLTSVDGARAKVDATAAILEKIRNATALSSALQSIVEDSSSFAESSVESLAWLNSMMEKIWPQTNAAINKIVTETVNPILASSLPGPMASLEVQPFTLTKVPKLGPIAVYETSDGLKIKLGMLFETDELINIASRGGLLKFAGASAGIKRLHIEGDLIIHLAPIIQTLPVIGGARVYFLNSPNIQLDFTGIANVADMYGISGMVRSAINSAIAEKLVLPNCIGIPLATPEQGVDESFFAKPTAMGLVRVSILKANNLPQSDWQLIGKGKADPYVLIETADRSWNTVAIPGSLNPVWTEGNSRDFVVYDKGQTVHLSVYDEDMITSNDMIGHAEPLTWSSAAGQEVTLALKNAEGAAAGSLTAKIDKLQLAECGTFASNGHVLKVDVDRITLPASLAQGASALFTIAGESKSTAQGHMAVSVQAVMADVVERMHADKMSVDKIAALTGLSSVHVAQVVRKFNASAGLEVGAANLRVGSLLYFPNLTPKGPMSVKIFDQDGNALAEQVVELASLRLQQRCKSKQGLRMVASGGEKIEIHFSIELMNVT
jgi:hypothetical protein